MSTLTTPPATPPLVSGRDAQAKFPKLAKVIDYLESLTGRADLAVLERLLGQLNITRADIEPICSFGTRSYKRNPIARNQHYEFLALCWRSGHCTPIHDHRGISCAFKVIHGTGTEIRFKPVPTGQICPCATTEMRPGYICSANDDDIHQVANFQPTGQDLITLHIYSPAISHMHTYRSADPDQAPKEYEKPVEFEDWNI